MVKNARAPDDGSSSAEIRQYLTICPLGEEDTSFIESMTLTSLLELPWHAQLRVVVGLPSNDLRMNTLLPHIASKVQQLEQDECDLAIIDDRWQNNVVFQHWVHSRRSILMARRNIHTTNSHMRMLWSIVHGMDQVLGEPSFDDLFEANPMYKESAKRQNDVLQRWRDVEQHRRVLAVFSMDHFTSLHSICAAVGAMNGDGLHRVYNTMRAQVTSQKVEFTVKALIRHDTTEGYARNGRAKLLAFMCLRRSEILKMPHVLLIGTGLGLLSFERFNSDLCHERIQEMTTRFVLGPEDMEKMRQEMMMCGLSFHHAETCLSSMLDDVPQTSLPLKVAPSGIKKRTRESAAAVVDKLYGNCSSKTAIFASHTKNNAHQAGDHSDNKSDANANANADDNDTMLASHFSTSGSDDDYDEANDSILLL